MWQSKNYLDGDVASPNLANFIQKITLGFRILRPSFYPFRLWHFQKFAQFLSRLWSISDFGEYSGVLVKLTLVVSS